MQVSLTSVSLRYLILLHELVYAHLLRKLHNETHFKIKGCFPKLRNPLWPCLTVDFLLVRAFLTLGQSGCWGMNLHRWLWRWLGYGTGGGRSNWLPLPPSWGHLPAISTVCSETGLLSMPDTWISLAPPSRSEDGLCSLGRTNISLEICVSGCVLAHFPNRLGQNEEGLLLTTTFSLLNHSSNLASNRISTLESGAFDGLSRSLLVLRLSKNRITQLPVKAFKLPRLTQLWV